MRNVNGNSLKHMILLIIGIRDANYPEGGVDDFQYLVGGGVKNSSIVLIVVKR